MRSNADIIQTSYFDGSQILFHIFDQTKALPYTENS